MDSVNHNQTVVLLTQLTLINQQKLDSFEKVWQINSPNSEKTEALPLLNVPHLFTPLPLTSGM